MTDPSSTEHADDLLRPGQRLFDETGREVGVIQAITADGVEVNTHPDIETVSLKHAPSADTGEGYLLWRCSECGAVGDLDQIPANCPDCGVDREYLYAYLED